jgi:hypothetical protein
MISALPFGVAVHVVDAGDAEPGGLGQFLVQQSALAVVVWLRQQIDDPPVCPWLRQLAARQPVRGHDNLAVRAVVTVMQQVGQPQRVGVGPGGVQSVRQHDQRPVGDDSIKNLPVERSVAREGVVAQAITRKPVAIRVLGRRLFPLQRARHAAHAAPHCHQV